MKIIAYGNFAPYEGKFPWEGSKKELTTKVWDHTCGGGVEQEFWVFGDFDMNISRHLESSLVH